MEGDNGPVVEEESDRSEVKTLFGRMVVTTVLLTFIGPLSIREMSEGVSLIARRIKIGVKFFAIHTELYQKKSIYKIMY